jgi:hypothetical protein
MYFSTNWTRRGLTEVAFSDSPQGRSEAGIRFFRAMQSSRLSPTAVVIERRIRELAGHLSTSSIMHL